MIRPVVRIAGSLLLAVGLVLHAEEAPDPAGGSAGDGGAPTASEEWEQLTELAQVEDAMRFAEAENLYLEARAHYQKAYFIEARELVEQALAVFPAHDGAQELREDILGVLAVRSDRLRMMARWLKTMGDVATQEEAVRLASLIDEGDKAMAARDYNAAARAYDRVAIGIRTFPYRFDWGELPEVIQSKIFEAQSEARREDLLRQRQARRDAAERAQAETARQEALLKAKVDTILARANRHFARRDYRRAAIEAWNAYELDRRREDARGLYLEARRQSHVQFDDYIREEKPERLARVNENIHAALIPQTELLVYPENWFEINLRKPQEIGDDVEEPWQRELRNRLEQEVEFIWEDTSLEDAIEFLRRQTGVNFVIGPDVYAGGGPAPITLSGRMKLGTVLNWISNITRLEYTIRNQAIFISGDETEGDTTLRIYNVTDLLSPVVDFPGPELAFAASGGDGGGFDLFGGGFDGGDEGLDIDQVVEFIETSVAPESWGNPGVAITIRQGGTLFITQTPEIHSLVDELLRNLRAQQSLQVNVRIRVLDVTKAFIEEIGIEWQNLDVDPGLLGSTTQNGFNRVGSTWQAAGRSSNVLPENAMTTGFDTTDAGIRMEGALNLTNTFNAPQLNVVLEALEQEADGTVLNAPELTCFNGQRANAQFMNQYAYIADYGIETGGGAGTFDPVIEVLNFGDIIDVKPLVSADRKYVTLEVRPSSVLLAGVFVEQLGVITTVANVAVPLFYPLELPNVEVRTLRTTVMLPDKGSVMLGGYSTGLRQRAHTGIPFLSHIPFLGRLFSKNGIYDENRHLMFLVTVTILDIAELEAQQ